MKYAGLVLMALTLTRGLPLPDPRDPCPPISAAVVPHAPLACQRQAFRERGTVLVWELQQQHERRRLERESSGGLCPGR